MFIYNGMATSFLKCVCSKALDYPYLATQCQFFFHINSKVKLMQWLDGSFKCKSRNLEIKSTHSNANCHSAQDTGLWISQCSPSDARLHLY